MALESLLAAGVPSLAVAVSAAGVILGRRDRGRERALLGRQFAQAASANVVLELTNLVVEGDEVAFELTAFNSGPAVARDLDVELRRDVDGKAFQWQVDQVKVAPALSPSGQREIRLVASLDTVAGYDLDIVAGWYDSSSADAIWERLILFLRTDEPCIDHAIYLSPRSGAINVTGKD